MKISKKSWHYRFLVLVCGCRRPTNLCEYVRNLCICLVALPMTIAFLVGISPLIGLILLIAWLWNDKIFPWLEQRSLVEIEEITPKQPSLLKQWFTAKKQKICPFIEYED